MTGYYIETGYQSGCSREEAWEEIKRITRYLCDHPNLLVKEALEFRAPATADGETILDYANKYKEQNDLTCRIIEKQDKLDPDEQIQHVVQYASGGGASRTMKEHLRRAFCRLVMNEMHRKGMEVNVRVS
jgi:hypothetical protein